MKLDELVNLFDKKRNHLKENLNKIDTFLCDLKRFLLLDYYESTNDNLNNYYVLVQKDLKEVLNDYENIEETTNAFFFSLPSIRKTLNTTIDAILDGDPASTSKQEIVLMYPGFEAIFYYRIAHEFLMLGFKIIARYISESVHQKTGIDIHPGATIGDYFFIDHGTGIVIGETCVIGNHVKIYQGVTLGALSLSKGRDLVGKKRHPTIEDNVTIYSNAAIFGGNTIIHSGSIIGGDVYLTHSIDENSIVLQTDKNLTILKKK